MARAGGSADAPYPSSYREDGAIMMMPPDLAVLSKRAGWPQRHRGLTRKSGTSAERVSGRLSGPEDERAQRRH